MAASRLVVLCRKVSASLQISTSLLSPQALRSTGAAWTCQQLRNKSNKDLHKLWYVLLKERNMLLTLEQEAKWQVLPMPSPEQLEKVVKSMDAFDKVVQERENALRLLQTGQEKAKPGTWRKDILEESSGTSSNSGLYLGT